MRASQFRFNVRDENEMNFFLLGCYLLISNKPQFPEQNSVKVILRSHTGGTHYTHPEQVLFV